jgi:hypothetical protein
VLAGSILINITSIVAQLRSGAAEGGTMRRELRVGEPAPELELPRETGEMVSLESLHGRAVLVSFLSHAA